MPILARIRVGRKKRMEKDGEQATIYVFLTFFSEICMAAVG